MKYLLLLTLLLCSCSAVKQIQQKSNSITSHAQTSKEHFEGIIQAASSTPPGIAEIQERSNQGISEQTAIIEEAKKIIEATSGVEDKVPWWAGVIEIVAIAVIIVGVLALLWNTGIGAAIRKMLGFIPEIKKDQAKLLDEALSGETNIREAIAFMRARDPMLDSAFKKRKEEANAQLQTNSTETTQS